MIHVLYIARYHTPMMERKIALMAEQPDLTLWLIRPPTWQDEYGQVQVKTQAQGYRVTPISLLGKTNDPHRALYRTFSFAMRQARPDIIHAEEEPDSLTALQIVIARRLFAPNAKLVLHTWQNINRHKNWLVWQVTRACLHSADAILGANQETMAVLTQMGYKGMAKVIPPQGVDVDTLHRHGGRPQSDTFIIAYVGRFILEKGLDTLIEAVQLLGPQTNLWLVGDGAYRPTLESLVRDRGLQTQVHFIAPVPAEQIPEIFAQVDALVLPSRTTPVWKEQFGRVLVEAMACKVPVIGSDSGAIPELISNTGLVFPEGDAVRLADCLRQIIQSPDLGRELAERGYVRAMRLYTQERIAEQTAKFYRRLLER